LTRRSWQRLVALVALSAVGFLTLVVLDVVQNSGLWGDFAFALLVTTVVIAIAGHTISDDRWEGWKVIPPTASYAPFWALLVLLDIPLAIVSWWAGALVLAAALAICWITPVGLRLGLGLTTATMLVFVGLLAALSGAQQPQVSDAVSLHGAGALAHRYRPILR